MKIIKICISGLTASGKTTLAKELSKKYKIPYFSFSEYLLSYYASYKQDLISKHDKNNHYWYYADILNKYRLKHLKIEKKIDQSFYKLVKKNKSTIFDSFSYPKLSLLDSNRAFCVLLLISKNIRTKRAFRSSQTLSKKKIVSYIKEKDGITNKILYINWNINIFKNSYCDYFDLIINDGILEQRKISLRRRLNIVIKIITIFYNIWKRIPGDKKYLHLSNYCKYYLKQYPNVIKKYPSF